MPTIKTTGFKLVLLSQLLVGSFALANCASVSPTLPSASAPSVEMESAAQDGLGNTTSIVETPLPAQPQLAKTADIIIRVNTIEQSLDSIKTITQQNQGDILSLNDRIPANERDHHSVFLQIRVPQQQLDSTLEALNQLGEIQQRSLTAEDVSAQLVDHQARLRNLRKTEATLLAIMDRSGGVADVLKVAQELSNVRNSIEQIDAQLNALQNRVAYSTISLTLEEAIASSRASSTQLQTTWETATSSLRRSTIDLMQLGIWLIVYSPYLLLLTGGIGVWHHWRRKSHQSNGSTASEPNP